MTAAEIKKIVEYCRKNSKIKLAYIFGSQINGYANKNSDVDIAFLLPKESSSSKRFELRIRANSELSAILKKEVSIEILNDLNSIFFKYCIIKEGKNIFSRSQLEKAEFESKIMALYFDFEPFLDLYNQHYVQSSH